MFKYFKYGLALLLSLIAENQLFAQKKVVIMGSSTAFGAATTSDSSWVSKMTVFYNQNLGDGLDTTFQVVGGYGYVTYFQMPTGYVPPLGRPSPQPENVDSALRLTPDIIIINLPTNDITANYTKKEMMDNLRYLRNYIFANGVPGVKLFVCTTQPRNDLNIERRDSLKTLVDSINNNFGAYAINFWTDLVTNDGLNNLRDEVRHLGFPDQDYHLNGIGHNYLFIRARDKNIFGSFISLPVVLLDFKVQKQNKDVKITWVTDQEEPSTAYTIQRSKDGLSFENLHSTSSRLTGQRITYSWIDQNALPGKSFYRLHITELARQFNSTILSIDFEKGKMAIDKIYKSISGNEMIAEISGHDNKDILLMINNVSGVVFYKTSTRLNNGNTRIEVPARALSSGLYFLTIINEDKSMITKSFIF